jgi:hypothetical protein
MAFVSSEHTPFSSAARMFSTLIKGTAFPATVELIQSTIARGAHSLWLFDYDARVGEPMRTELEAWKQALEAGLISDLPVADEEGGEVLPPDFHVRQVDEAFDPRPDWRLPREIS